MESRGEVASKVGWENVGKGADAVAAGGVATVLKSTNTD